jgi:NAD(P)-dependent dehydrogenase (short-subunit alcohol dehydrogenase family)
MAFDFSDQVVVVTGAAGNLGRAVVQGFVDAGARVALVDRNQQMVEEIMDEAMRTTCKPYGADLTDPGDVNRVVNQIAADFGRIDALAHTVGGFAMGDPVHAADISVLDKMLTLNVRPIFLMGGAVAKHMVDQGIKGSIVFVIAQAGRKGGKHKAAYTASKAAAARIMESMAEELKEHGINVNGVSPSTIDTPPNRESMPNADFSRWVTPEQLADSIMFLCSPEASAIHGVDLSVSNLS